jgi:aspartyl-tRNA(Asn)/glutamyl-tRNA(Gln) amidotransferase subunit A
MQIVGRAFDEATVLRVADAYQRITDWHSRRPPVGSDAPAA